MIPRALLLATMLMATCVAAAPVTLLESPVRVVVQAFAGPTPNKVRMEISVNHASGNFALSVLQRGTFTEALASQKATSGWKDGYLFIRDDCLSDDPATAGWRCVVDHVFTLAAESKGSSSTRLIYIGDVFAGEECIDAARIGCALYKDTFTDIYDRLEQNTLGTRTDSPALLLELIVDGGVFTVSLEETWKANQERFLGGMRCLQAKPDTQKARCTDGITPRRAYLFNTALTTYTHQQEPLERSRTFARTALCENGPAILADAECSETLRAAALLFAGIKPGLKAFPRGKVSSRVESGANFKP